MNALISAHDRLFGALENLTAAWLMPTLARFAFAATLVTFFWNSAKTKLGEGIGGLFSPSFGAYAQIFPKQMEAAGYDISNFGAFHTLVVIAGMWAEFILPLLIVIGFATRLSSLAMIGFIAVLTLTDLYGHGAIGVPETLGAWFDGKPDSVILDQRLLWLVPLILLVVRGAGPISIDGLLRRSQAVSG